MLKLVAKGIKLSGLLKPLLLVPWIALILIFATLTSWLDSQIACFPVTVITTAESTVKSVQQNFAPCLINVSQSNLAIDSRLLNDNERPSVKTIWLIRMKLPYEDVESLRLLPEAEVEINSFVKESALNWQNSRIKTVVLLCFIATIFGIMIALLTPFSADRIGITRKQSHIFYSLWLILLTLPTLIFTYTSPFFVPALLSISTVVFTAILFQIIHNRSID